MIAGACPIRLHEVVARARGLKRGMCVVGFGTQVEQAETREKQKEKNMVIRAL
jgi:hypothetical protein